MSPLAPLNVQSVDWERDFLPDHLWIAALADHFGLERFLEPYRSFLDALDSVAAPGHVPLGLLSDFAQIPEAQRDPFRQEHRELVQELFLGLVGGWLSLYPDNPAAWLTKAHPPAPDPMAELACLRRLTTGLLPGKDTFAARVRALPLSRLFKHDKIRLASGLSVIPLLPRYPVRCTTNECLQVEAFARATLNQYLARTAQSGSTTWATYFWRHNFNLAVCVPKSSLPSGTTNVDPTTRARLIEILLNNATLTRTYVSDLSRHLTLDLYDPLPGEILFGLFGRVTRLYCLLVETPELLARDIGGIILRCLADTAITFCYLATRGSDEDFRRFQSYGEGQEKLLMLHLQDNHPDGRTVEGMGADEMAILYGGFPLECLDIELGHWTKKDTRTLAHEAGVESLYRLVFSPTSGDVHGTWVSLKQSNLITCAETLHRFHRLASLVEPPVFLNVADVAAEVYEHCVRVAAASKGYPALPSSLERLSALFPAPPTEEI